jgi:3',5'-cyclic AMP phosphodiesterase CpdA
MSERCTRRRFLRTSCLSAGALALPGMEWAVDARPASELPFTFVQICDPQIGMVDYELDKARFAQAVRQCNALKPDFAVICGDLVNGPKEERIADFNRIRQQLKSPCHCVPGNHDIGLPPTPEYLARYRARIGKDYYAIEHKGFTFLMVNTQLWKSDLGQESAAHDTWFDASLKGARAAGRPIFIVGHCPLFTERPDEPEGWTSLPPIVRQRLLGLFEEHGVVAMAGGHTHRLVVTDYRGIQIVHGEGTCKNVDGRPLGFRLWTVGSARPYQHQFVALEPQTPAIPARLEALCGG